MKLEQVRQWARARSVSAPEFRAVYEAALLHAISRLLQAIHRESRTTRLSQDSRGSWLLEVGDGAVVCARVSGPLPFRRLETIELPWVVESGRRRPLRTVRAFVDALAKSLSGSEYEKLLPALRSDFENSVANVVLNRLIGGSLNGKSRAIEPAYQGHQYYPFPALRIGPSLPQVLDCSHLSATAVELPLLEIGGCAFVSGAFESYEACVRAWSGLEVGAGTALRLPLHPWQLHLSPLVRELLARKLAKLSAATVEAMPLASQRTCRVLRTGFDLKLPVNATLTGEHRLLYRLNCRNAPVVSAVARSLLHTSGSRTIDFQDDIASVFHAESVLAPHLSAIVRAPVGPRPGELLIPAINLWTGREEAWRLLAGADSARGERFFEHYCRALMAGPVRFCSELGMAFEPHLQNVYVGLRDGLPTRVVLRDLDNSILDRARVKPVLRQLGAELAEDTWLHMPAYEVGAKRLVQAMLFGHLGEVISCLTQMTGAPTAKLVTVVSDTWSDLAARAPSAAARRSVNALRGWSDSVKATLHTRLTRSTSMRFVRE